MRFLGFFLSTILNYCNFIFLYLKLGKNFFFFRVNPSIFKGKGFRNLEFGHGAYKVCKKLFHRKSNLDSHL